jgi:hypothetical protein
LEIDGTMCEEMLRNEGEWRRRRIREVMKKGCRVLNTKKA